VAREDAPAAKVLGAADEKQIAGARVKRRVRFKKGTGDSRWRPAGDALRGNNCRRCGDYAEDEQPNNISPQDADVALRSQPLVTS